MASQQAWDDFCALKASEDCLEGELARAKDDIGKLEALVGAIVADPARAAEAVALADQHPEWTSAHVLDVYNRLLVVRTAISGQGF